LNVLAAVAALLSTIHSLLDVTTAKQLVVVDIGMLNLFSDVLCCAIAGSGYKGHVESLAPAVKQLAALEKRAQSSYLNLIHNKPFATRR